ncbi:MAG: hypothetical protein ACYC6Y_19195, partial [Thermoguttaceae bacterium]
MPGSATAHTEGHCRPDRHNPKRWKRVLFPAAAVVLGLLPLVLIEGALRALKMASPQAGGADGAGFDASEVFELDEDDELYRTARNRLLFFDAQQFAAQKPAGTFRIFGLGGSTVYGHPYETGSCFLKWMELELAGRDPSRTYESVNCGGISYASYRLTKVLQEVLRYDPDLVV